MPLDNQRDSSWPLGSFRAGATEEEPGGSAYEILGLLGDDSKPYRRGGTTYKSNAALGTTGLLGLWSGTLAAGRPRTLMLAASNVGVLDTDDSSVVDLTTRIADEGTAWANPGVTKAVSVAGVAAFAPGYVWGGATTGLAPYSTGTVAASLGSPIITGTGTNWVAAGIKPGHIYRNGFMDYAIKSVDSATQLTLAAPCQGTAVGSGLVYEIHTFRPLRDSSTAAVITTADLFAVAGNRLCIATRNGDTMRFSTVLVPTAFSGYSNYHQFSGGIIAMASLRDTLLVFTEMGVYAVENLALELTDAAGNPQQRKELVNADLIAWAHEGIAPFRGALVVPALDGVWLMDATSGPVRISDRIADLYEGYVRAGYTTGVAEVFNAHYFLPILNGTTWVDTLVCRLQPTLSGGQYAWTQLAGSGASVRAYAERSSSPPKLLGASSLAASRVIEATSYFSPSASVKNDADGTTHTWRFTTRNIAIGDRPTGVIYMRAWYSLVDAGSDNPTITAEASVDGGSWTTLSVTTGTDGTTVAGEQDGSQAVYWAVGLAGRFIRFRFTCTNPAASLQFKLLEFFYRSRAN